MSEQMSSNFYQLKNFLNEKGQFISSDEFKAVLHAMNLMTVYYKKKAESIKASSKKHKVSQKFIKGIIDEIGFIGVRYEQVKKDFGKYNGIGMNAFQKVLER